MTTALPAPQAPGAVSPEVCRLTIAGPAGRADLAVPVTTTVATLLPALSRHLPAQPGRPTGAWTLQRLGEPPLDLDATPRSAGLVHGDVLYLRTVDDPMPELTFDDIADGVSHAVAERANRWRPELTRGLFLALACVVLAVLAVAVGKLGGDTATPVLYAVAAVALGAGCAADRRRPADRTAALITGGGAVVFAALAGLTAVHGVHGLTHPRPVDLMTAGGCAAAVAGALLPVPRLRSAVSGTLLLTAALTLATGAAATRFGGDIGHGAATVAVAAFLLGHLAPRTSLRLARIRVPQLPRNAAELQEDTAPHPERQVTRRAMTADNVLTAISVSTALLCTTAFALLLGQDDWIGWLFPLVFSAALLLRAKNLNATWQRVPGTVCGTLGLLSVVLTWTEGSSTGPRCVLLAGLLLAAGLLLTGAWRLPTARLLPIWGHLADILELVTALALLPLLLQLLHVYAHVRAAVG
ncbi:type VII secretion integral membrane protein EccD [Streptantibioticus parmotrematis]|uniref:type VII secretion integral membrane protein EccD n=1 Tax=Streptantibioticus parmotrematis TaxID=2873249 RepID=UPI00340400F3